MSGGNFVMCIGVLLQCLQASTLGDLHVGGDV